jgi:hypothetical protein
MNANSASGQRFSATLDEKEGRRSSFKIVYQDLATGWQCTELLAVGRSARKYAPSHLALRRAQIAGSQDAATWPEDLLLAIKATLRRPCRRCRLSESLKSCSYCKSCKKALISEMQQAGYLQNVPKTRCGESFRDTGNWNGGTDNLHRAYEDYEPI